MDAERRFNKLKRAFKKDGFDVVDLGGDRRFSGIPGGFLSPYGCIVLDDGRGNEKMCLLAEHETVKSVTGQPKRAFYVEGSHYQMGFMMGLVAEPETRRMAYDYVDDVVFDFMQMDLPKWLYESLGTILADIMYPGAAALYEKSVPGQYKDEFNGMIDGCLAVNGKTDKKELTRRLKVLNCGIDSLLAHLYTGKTDREKPFMIPPFLLRPPVMCNAFSISGDPVVDNGHFFGRDFMFPTAGVFQDTACVVIYRPDRDSVGGSLPIISQTAPGFLGSIAAMNSEGVAIGVDISPTVFCNAEDPGFNSLLLNRCAMHACPDMGGLHQFMRAAPRGVSWLYPAADGKSGTSCVFETGERIETFPYLQNVDNVPLTHYPKKYLPERAEVEQIRQAYPGVPEPEMGMVPRYDNYNADYTLEFNRRFNEDLWNRFPLWAINITLRVVNDWIEKMKAQKPLDIKHLLEQMAGLFSFGGKDGAREHAPVATSVPQADPAFNRLVKDEKFSEAHRLFGEAALGKVDHLDLEHLSPGVPGGGTGRAKTLGKIFLDRSAAFMASPKYNPDWFGERAYINKAEDDEKKGFQLEANCPGPYYFAPQRENLPNVSLVSNHCISPEMRMNAMSVWLYFVALDQWNDIQWRYDELNHQLLGAVDGAVKSDAPQKIDEEMAWKLINFLSPEPGYKYPHYYHKNPKIGWENVVVQGSVSLFDLKKKTLLTRFGYYGDRPVKLTLPNYLV